MSKRYTDEFLISELHRFNEENNRIPTAKYFHYNADYPSEQIYKIRFGSWNNALIAAGLHVRKYTRVENKPNICEICGTVESPAWLDKMD